MSHFCTLVVLPKEFVAKNVESEVARLLAPYGENFEVEPYVEWMNESDITMMKTKYNTSKIEELLLYMQEWNDGPGILENGKLGYLTTYNPQTYWDYYDIGHGCNGRIPNNQCLVSQIPQNVMPFVIITPDGKWYEYREKKRSWFAVKSKENENLVIEMFQIRNRYGDHIAVMVDCHI